MSDGGAVAHCTVACNFLASYGRQLGKKAAMEKRSLKVAEPLYPTGMGCTLSTGAKMQGGTLLRVVALEENTELQLPPQEILPCGGNSLDSWLSHTQLEWCDVLTLIVPVSVSTVFHVAMLFTFQMWAMPEIAQSPLPDLIVEVQEETEEKKELLKELETVELDEQIEAATEIEFIAGSSASWAGSISTAVSNPQLDSSILQQDAEQQKVSLESLNYMPGKKDMLNGLPEGTRGKARVVVNDYKEAIDRITQEIISMLSEDKVLVIWCFDQSESMKDDQQEISERIERV